MRRTDRRCRSRNLHETKGNNTLFWLRKSCIFAENINQKRRTRKLVTQVDRQQAIGMMIEEPILPQLPDFEEYILQGEPDQRQRAENWQIAIGLQAVDGLHTSDYLLQLARQHIEGKITMNDVKRLLNDHYKSSKVPESQSAKNTFQSANGDPILPPKCKNCTLEEVAVLQCILKRPNITQKEMAAIIGKSERTVKSITVRLSEQGIISRKNGKRNGYWEILND